MEQCLDKSQIRQKLKSIDVNTCHDPRFKPSAVLLPLFIKDREIRLLFTLRTSHVATHKGQISFPGGAFDPEDKDEVSCALRETDEELGIKPGDVEILGRLDDINTITLFRISPVVGWIPYPYEFRVSEDEIAEVFDLPLFGFLEPAVFRREDGWELEGKTYPVYFFAVEGRNVWGATARILKQFLELVFGWREPA